MSEKDVRPKATSGQSDGDTKGHGLMVHTNYSQRRLGRTAELRREQRERRQAKETRSNRRDRY